ncbi:type II secretion system F family protein [Aliiroseovarius sp. YM-037]|uniref:type II secretion system F family protein n=1 Tax=Aliiroseovarius sp. YM-037 TaxID=3341728 RepID=UPI003A80CCEB
MEFINSLNTMLTDNFGELGPLLAVGILGLFLVLLTLPVLMNKKEDPLDKLRKANMAAKSKPSEQRLRQGTKNDKLEKYSNFLEPQDEEEYSAARLKLLQAGYRSKQAVRTYHFLQFALGLGMLGLGALLAFIQSVNGDPSATTIILTIMMPGIVGYMLPKYWVNRRLQSRQEEITNGFPDSLDMMLVCVEAGQSMDQSIIRVAGEIKAGFPALAEEYEIVAHEMKAGKDKTQVLRDMSERAGVQDVSSFVTVLIQSATFGTSIAEALRVYAGEMRDKRVMRAEEKANTLPTKMTLATMALTVPPLLIILVGPSVYGIAQTLSSIGQ